MSSMYVRKSVVLNVVMAELDLGISINCIPWKYKLIAIAIHLHTTSDQVGAIVQHTASVRKQIVALSLKSPLFKSSM